MHTFQLYVSTLMFFPGIIYNIALSPFLRYDSIKCLMTTKKYFKSPAARSLSFVCLAIKHEMNLVWP